MALRGISYYALQQDQNALVDFCKAIELKPNDVWSITMRAAAYFRLGELDLALLDRNKVIELEPNTNHRFFERAEVYRALDKLSWLWPTSSKGSRQMQSKMLIGSHDHEHTRSAVTSMPKTCSN